MKRKTVFFSSIIAMSAIIPSILCESEDASQISLSQSEVEVLTACESIGWWDNDGNCVKNSNTGEYFCKDDSWPELTDCLR